VPMDRRGVSGCVERVERYRKRREVDKQGRMFVSLVQASHIGSLIASLGPSHYHGLVHSLSSPAVLPPYLPNLIQPLHTDIIPLPLYPLALLALSIRPQRSDPSSLSSPVIALCTCQAYRCTALTCATPS
jgi:hypothetical protein